MELRHLRYFVAVAEELHFRRAAERLHVAQPAVSEQVRKLEDELGVRLLDRSQRSVSLTDAGAAFLTEARHVLQGAEVARVAARNARQAALHRLRIGYMPASLPVSVPRTLQRLTTGMVHVQTSLQPGNPGELIDAVRADRLDAAIISLPAPTAGLRSTPLGDEHAVAALPISHRHAVSSEIRLDQMLPERIVVLAAGSQSRVLRRRRRSLSRCWPRADADRDARWPSRVGVAGRGVGRGHGGGSSVGCGAAPRSGRPLRSARRSAAGSGDRGRDPPRHNAPTHRGVPTHALQGGPGRANASDPSDCSHSRVTGARIRRGTRPVPEVTTRRGLVLPA